MPPTFEGRLEPNFYHLAGHFGGDQPLSDRNDIGVVMLTGQFRRLGIPTKGATNALNTVGDDGFAVSRTAQDNPSFEFSSAHCLSNRANKQWIINRFFGMRPEIGDAVAQFLQKVAQLLFVVETCVVGANGNFH